MKLHRFCLGAPHMRLDAKPGMNNGKTFWKDIGIGVVDGMPTKHAIGGCVKYFHLNFTWTTQFEYSSHLALPHLPCSMQNGKQSAKISPQHKGVFSATVLVWFLHFMESAAPICALIEIVRAFRSAMVVLSEHLSAITWITDIRYIYTWLFESIEVG